MATFYNAEIGRLVQERLGFDVTGFTEITVTIDRPDGTNITKTQTGGTVTVDDAGTGQISWRSASGDFNQNGEYFWQVRIDGLTSGGQIYSEVYSFFVEAVVA